MLWPPNTSRSSTAKARNWAIRPRQLDTFLNFVCHASIEREIFFRWRPFLTDPDDEMVLELAVACAASHLVTFNKRDFADAERFGISVLTLGEFLAVLRS